MKVEHNSRRSVDPLIEKIRATGRYDQVTFGQKRDPCDVLFKKFRSAFQVPREPAAGLNNIAVTIAPDVPGMKVGQSGPEAVLTPPNHSPNAAAEESKKRKTSRFKNLTAFTDTSSFKHLDPGTRRPSNHSASPASRHSTPPSPVPSPPHMPTSTQKPATFTTTTATSPCLRRTYRIWKTDRKIEKTEIIATIKDADAACAYLHSSFITDNFFILPIWSSHMQKGWWYLGFMGGILGLMDRCRVLLLSLGSSCKDGCKDHVMISPSKEVIEALTETLRCCLSVTI